MEEERLISEFNEAKFQIFRLHNIWLECKNLREKGKLILCMWKLDTGEIELWNDAKRLDENNEKTKDYEKYIDKLKNINDKLYKNLKVKNFIRFYQNLINKERLLREIQEGAGKGAKFRPADDDYM